MKHIGALENESVLRARLALQAGGLVAWEIDFNARTMLFDAGLAELFGASNHPQRLETFLERILPEDKDGFIARLETAAAGGHFRCEFRVQHDDGSIRWLLSVGAYNPDRKTVIGYTTDITKEREDRERLSIALEGAALGSWHWSIHSGHVVYNARWAEMLGYSIDEIEPHFSSWQRLVHPEDLVRVLEALENYVHGRSESYQIEHRLQHKSGSWVWVLTQGKIVRRDKDNRPLLVSGTHLDVTRRYEMEDALRTSEERLRALMDAAPVGISFTTEKSATTVFGNREAHRQFESSPSDNISATALNPDAAGRKIRYFDTEGNVVDSHDLPLQQAVLQNRPIGPNELVVELPSGRTWYCEAIAAPIQNAFGDAVAGVAVTLDVTQRKQAAEQEKVLIGEINHRAKNLLAVVQAIARQTRRFSSSEGYVDRLSDRINALAASHDLLAQSQWKGVDLYRLVSGQLAHLSDILHERIVVSGANLRLNAAAAQALGMCFHELATNAAKHGALSTETGKIEITWLLVPGDQLEMSWIETGGPPVTAMGKAGFGHRVLLDAASWGLGGKAEMIFDDAGFKWQLTAPQARVLQD